MKHLIVLTLLITCNQQVYDSLYHDILVHAVRGEWTMPERNKTINVLRKLCRGQLSTFETAFPRTGDVK